MGAAALANSYDNYSNYSYGGMNNYGYSPGSGGGAGFGRGRGGFGGGRGGHAGGGGRGGHRSAPYSTWRLALTAKIQARGDDNDS